MKFSGKFASAAIFAAFGIAAMAAADIGPFSSIGQSLRMSGQLTESTVGFITPDAELFIGKVGSDPDFTGPDAAGLYQISRTRIRAKVKLDGTNSGTVNFYLSGTKLASEDFLSRTEIEKELDLSSIENGSSAELKAVVVYADAEAPKSECNQIRILVDTEGPLLTSVRLVGDPTSAAVGVKLQFRDSDFEADGDISSDDFIISRTLSTETDKQISYVADEGARLKTNRDDGTVTLAIVGPLVVGEYKVSVRETFKDRVGNPAGRINTAEGIKTQERTLPTGVFRPTGPAIDFPQYTQREKLDPDTNFNPGDHVETRVVRLYYNRDAHRVAQIINRDIKQWNRAGVNDARKVATQARSEADTARTRREKEEQLAINASKKVRTLERRLEDAKTKREAAQRKLEEVKRLKEAISDLGPASGTGVASDTDSLFQEIRFATINCGSP